MTKLCAAVAALGLMAIFSAEVGAQKKALTIGKKWSGSVADETLRKGAPECITTMKGLEKLWKAWKLEGSAPKVDFAKEIVIITTTVGSRVNLSASLDNKGDLSILGLGTSDFGTGFRYVMGTVSREGVKTVNRKPLPKD
jgi:hypothetical protein